MTNYDSFLHCHLTDIFFRYSRGSKRVKIPYFSYFLKVVLFLFGLRRRRRRFSMVLLCIFVYFTYCKLFTFKLLATLFNLIFVCFYWFFFCLNHIPPFMSCTYFCCLGTDISWSHSFVHVVITIS